MNNEDHDILVRLDANVKSIYDRLPLLATVEKVEAIEAKIDDHINNSRWTIGNIVALIGSIGGLIAGCAALAIKLGGN